MSFYLGIFLVNESCRTAPQQSRKKSKDLKMSKNMGPLTPDKEEMTSCVVFPICWQHCAKAVGQISLKAAGRIPNIYIPF